MSRYSITFRDKSYLRRVCVQCKIKVNEKCSSSPYHQCQNKRSCFLKFCFAATVARDCSLALQRLDTSLVLAYYTLNVMSVAYTQHWHRTFKT